MAKEKCLNCGRGIGDLETAYIWNERIVCRSCYVKLQPRSGVSKGLLLVLGTVVVAAIGGAAFWILGPTRPPAPAAVRAPTVASAAPEPTSNAELERLRAENARLVRQVAARPSAPAFTAPPAPPAPEPTSNAELERLRAENARLGQQVAARPSAPAFTAPPAPKGVAVSGSAYVVRQGGQSDILRGFHVALIRKSVPPQVLQRALTTAVRNYEREAAEKTKKAAQERKERADLKLSRDSGYDPGKYQAEEAKTAQSKAQKYSQVLAGISGPVDSAEALKLLAATSYVNVITELVDQVQIAATTTDVQGAYKFADAPADSYIFAMFDTRDGFLIWAVPVHGGRSMDLFNDTALVLK